ncbi:PAS domain S-box protein [Sporolactobacillus sp. THM7-7]|nr:PAS domain S-box protein [Sporolactobacillus sp. THM7-7]
MNSHSQAKEYQIDFQHIVEHTSDGIIVLEADQIVYANPAAKRFLSLKANPYKDLTIDSYLRAEDLVLLHEKMHRVIFYRTEREMIHLSMPVEGKKKKPLEVMITPLRSPDATLVQLTLRDISERRAAEQGLMQSEKLSVIGELSAGILHEVKNPLTAIKGFLQLLQKAPSRINEYLSILMSEVEQIEKITNELLYFTKPKEEHFVAQELTQIAEETLFLFESQASRKKVTFALQSEGKNHWINGDRTQLKQVFVNLVKNALEASAANDRITITLSSAGSLEQVQVRDTGVGIPKILLDKIGQSFFTTKESGTGLGLMVTFNIIRNHNGKMTVDSKENEGTAFTLTFPRIEEP